jgi:methyl-accepting chemotaxis protein
MLLTKLKEIIATIVIGSGNIASASQQISSGSQQLSQGASEQAASVEEVSSTMEEISANIQQNTENSQQTEKKSQMAHMGINEVAERAQKAMEANKNIADKITIINDIAFQTNILALNAAVEAARAGEHGKGFAVVAAEVRKLAERSKVAAEEIVDLTQNSLELAEGAGQKMMEILPEVEKTSQLVQEITAASIEQNNGASQVNNAVQQLNTVTQQNSAASEELATSSEEMAAQAEQLKAIVSFFKVDDDQRSVKTNYGTVKNEKKTSSVLNSFEDQARKSTAHSANNGDSVKLAKGVLINVAQENDNDSDYESF